MNETPQTPAEILKKIRTLEIKTKGLVETAFAGDYHSVFKGRGMNFEDVREYQPGDEIRAIDWNVTARLGSAFVKKFTEERELTVVLVVDVSASGSFGSVSQLKRELAAEVACLLAFSAIRNNDKVGLLLFTDRVELFIPPKKGRSHTLRLIRERWPSAHAVTISLPFTFTTNAKKFFQISGSSPWKTPRRASKSR